MLTDYGRSFHFSSFKSTLGLYYRVKQADSKQTDGFSLRISWDKDKAVDLCCLGLVVM